MGGQVNSEDSSKPTQKGGFKNNNINIIIYYFIQIIVLINIK